VIFFLSHSVILDAYKWLVCRLLVDSTQRLQKQMSAGQDSFAARNNSQVYYCRTLSLAYIEVYKPFSYWCLTVMLLKICSLYSKINKRYNVLGVYTFHLCKIKVWSSWSHHTEIQGPLLFNG
jgi:hypothetical protein